VANTWRGEDDGELESWAELLLRGARTRSTFVHQDADALRELLSSLRLCARLLQLRARGTPTPLLEEVSWAALHVEARLEALRLRAPR
jgi:hypothetical protein